ncbi:MAG: IS3 family transposase, partial [Erysipelotrichia bacterium]|nr:IS3 family transposase [Erysipelotrichia bacterium]
TERIEAISKWYDINLKKTTEISKNTDDKKSELKQQIEVLKEEVFRLQLERDILEKTSEILKKGMSICPTLLMNREKAILIDALKEKYEIKILLRSLDMAKSSYFYHKNILKKPNKYENVKKTIQRSFHESGKTYGYRRMYASLKHEGIRISEKVICKIMNEDQFIIYKVKKRKYSSYKGEISPAIENLVNREFHADRPNKK